LGPNKMSARSIIKKISPEKPKSIVLFSHNTAAFLKKGRDFLLTFPIKNVPQLYAGNEHLTEVRNYVCYRGSRVAGFAIHTGRNACKLVMGWVLY
jgi:hypothetical protein